jgi:hypothetical protein
MEELNGPISICQSCAMPLTEGAHFGTEADGSRSADYCRHCYQRGAFTQPEVGMEDMRDFVIDFIAREGHMTPEEARTTMERVFPTLKRWRAL